MTRFWRRYDMTETVLAVLMLSATVLTVLAAAIGRTAGAPVTSAPQFAQLFLIWTVMLGADVTLKRGEHIRVSALFDLFPVGLRRGLAALHLALILGFLGFVAWYGAHLALGNWARELGASGVSYGYVTLALPVGAALFAVSLLRRLVVEGLDATLQPADRHTESVL